MSTGPILVCYVVTKSLVLIQIMLVLTVHGAVVHVYKLHNYVGIKSKYTIA